MADGATGDLIHTCIKKLGGSIYTLILTLRPSFMDSELKESRLLYKSPYLELYEDILKIQRGKKVEIRKA